MNAYVAHELGGVGGILPSECLAEYYSKQLSYSTPYSKFSMIIIAGHFPIRPTFEQRSKIDASLSRSSYTGNSYEPLDDEPWPLRVKH